GRTALVAISSERRCWLQRPRLKEKRYRYQGEDRAKRVVADPDSAASMVAAVAATLPASSWDRRKGAEGTKGPIVYEFGEQPVTLCKDGLPDRTVWLVLKRTVGAEPSYAYAISNAPASTPLSTLVRRSSCSCFAVACGSLKLSTSRSTLLTGRSRQSASIKAK